MAVVTNYGTFGLEWATPIPLPEQSLVLGLGAAKVVPVWDEATKSFQPVRQAPLTLSFDHRVIDGGAAGRLLARVAELLENPEKLKRGGIVIFDVGFLIFPGVAGRGLLTQRTPRTQRSEKGEFVIFNCGFLILPAVAGHGRAYACKAPTPAPTLVGAGRGRVAKLGKGRGEGIRLVRTMVGSLLVGRIDQLSFLGILF